MGFDHGKEPAETLRSAIASEALWIRLDKLIGLPIEYPVLELPIELHNHTIVMFLTWFNCGEQETRCEERMDVMVVPWPMRSTDVTNF
jgi:hypothetical protein